MNSGVPGSPYTRGPLFHAYQYVTQLPSASCFLIELIPFSLVLMVCNPSIQIIHRRYTISHPGLTREHGHFDVVAYGRNLDSANLKPAFEHGINGILHD